jgi:glycosyltransferase involved in cell wall biosynthesis
LPPDKLNNLYLNRYAWPGPLIAEKPNPEAEIIVVIPCYREPDILKSLESLNSCNSPNCHTEVIVLINHSESESQDIKEFNEGTAVAVEDWIRAQSKSGKTFQIIRAFDLPEKQAGVGLARKIGLDEGVRRFEYLGKKNGILVWFDADSLCTPNYLTEIYDFYRDHPDANTGLVYFEHPLSGEEKEDVYKAIINYELHLRYYKNALQFANFPYGFHTIGSCITHTSAAYQKQGGMNTRKAGEDFYFLQKLFVSGGMYNINTAMVIPSPRPSDRVPFGTGKAVKYMLEKGEYSMKSYNPNAFLDFKKLIEKVPELYRHAAPIKIIDVLPESIRQYLEKTLFLYQLEKIKKNCSAEAHFLKAFYTWFNGFSALKFVHFARDHFYEDIEVLDAANWVLDTLTDIKEPVSNPIEALGLLRASDKSDQIK